jgi:uridine kinase
MQVADLDAESIDRLGEQGVFIVGLAGASGSGKSTVAKRVASRLKGTLSPWKATPL